MDLSIQKRTEPNGVVVLQLGGGIVAGRCDALERALADAVAAGAQCVVLDLGGVTFLDSAGIGSVVACLSRLKKAGGELRIAAASGRVLEVLQMTQVDKVVRMFPDAAAAMK
jgi:anti-anti-sigma factor